MNAPDKLSGLLGLAKRAGRLTVGFDASIAAVTAGQSDTLLLAVDGSPKTEKECRFVAATHDTHVCRLPLDKASLAMAIGAHKPVAVVAVTDGGFAKAIRSYCIDTKEEYSL